MRLSYVAASAAACASHLLTRPNFDIPHMCVLPPCTLAGVLSDMERRTGFEPARPAWKAGMLPTTSAAHIPPHDCREGIEGKEDKEDVRCMPTIQL